MALNIPVDMIKVDIGEFTADVSRDDIEHVVSGSGIFDTLMETATEHLKAQFEGNRIREEDYALAYIEIYKATLQAALQERRPAFQICECESTQGFSFVSLFSS